MLILMGLALIACWLVVEIRARSKYDQLRRDEAVTYSVTPMDRQSAAFLAQVQSHWRCWADIRNGPDLQALEVSGKEPTVHNLIDMFNYQMPPFQWLWPSENRQAIALSLVKAQFMPPSLDKQWHVSPDEHVAFLICKSNMVALYQDERSGVRTSYYVETKAP